MTSPLEQLGTGTGKAAHSAPLAPGPGMSSGTRAECGGYGPSFGTGRCGPPRQPSRQGRQNASSGPERAGGGLGGLDPELPHLLVEVAPLESEASSGLGDVAVFEPERLLDPLLLEPTHLLGEARVVVLDARWLDGGSENAIDGLGTDARTGRHDDQPLDDVPKLAHVARVGIAGQSLDGGWAECFASAACF